MRKRPVPLTQSNSQSLSGVCGSSASRIAESYSGPPSDTVPSHSDRLRRPRRGQMDSGGSQPEQALTVSLLLYLYKLLSASLPGNTISSEHSPGAALLHQNAGIPEFPVPLLLLYDLSFTGGCGSCVWCSDINEAFSPPPANKHYRATLSPWPRCGAVVRAARSDNQNSDPQCSCGGIRGSIRQPAA